MKKLLLALLILFPIWASAQESETVASEYDLPTIVERIMDKRDSIKNDGYQIRKINPSMRDVIDLNHMLHEADRTGGGR